MLESGGPHQAIVDSSGDGSVVVIGVHGIGILLHSTDLHTTRQRQRLWLPTAFLFPDTEWKDAVRTFPNAHAPRWRTRLAQNHESFHLCVEWGMHAGQRPEHASARVQALKCLQSTAADLDGVCGGGPPDGLPAALHNADLLPAHQEPPGLQLLNGPAQNQHTCSAQAASRTA